MSREIQETGKKTRRRKWENIVNYNNTFRSKGVCKLKLKDLNKIYDKLVPQKQNLIIKRTKVKKMRG